MEIQSMLTNKEDSKLSKISVLPYLIYRFNAIPSKFKHIICEYQQILNFVWRCKRPRTANIILNNKLRKLTPSNFKTCYKVTVGKTVWYWWKNRQIDQWSRMQKYIHTCMHIHTYIEIYMCAYVYIYIYVYI
jgi:hypothetical protein